MKTPEPWDMKLRLKFTTRVCVIARVCVNHAKNNAYAYRVDNEAAQNDDSSMPTWRKYNQKIYK